MGSAVTASKMAPMPLNATRNSSWKPAATEPTARKVAPVA